MSEVRNTRRIARRFLFLTLCLVLVIAKLLPLGANTSGWPGPDLVFCLVIAWVLRRPEDLPYWFLAPVLLLCDLLLMRPPGLWAVLTLIACEFLYRRRTRTRSLPFFGEILLVGFLFVAMIAAQWAVMALLFVDQTSLVEQLRQVPATLLAYPLVVLIFHFVLGIRKRPAPEGFGRGASA